MKIDELREKYPEFVYESFSYELDKSDLIVNYRFTIGSDIHFNPRIIIKNVEKNTFEKLDKDSLDNLIFNLGLSEIPSYWKSTCSSKILIKAGNLDSNQIKWWTKLFIKGMGQYYFENSINFTVNDFLTIISDYPNDKSEKLARVESSKVLIPVGGGKDSSVTLDIIKRVKDVSAFILNENEASNKIISITEANLIRVDRYIDPVLLELNKTGYLNGHTPITAVLSFLTVLVSYLFDFKYIAFSNESSSNEGNISYLGLDINHQYSKTLEFENDFRDYNKTYLSDINYFSFLRPLNELQISKVFSELETYHNLFLSCNIGKKDNKWCNNCPKCLSTFILLYGFLGPEKTVSIFGTNLYDNKDLTTLLISLIEESKVKPFECVGTRNDIKAGLFLSLQKHKEDLPYLLQLSRDILGSEINNEFVHKMLKSWSENNLDSNFEDMLRKYIWKT